MNDPLESPVYMGDVDPAAVSQLVSLTDGTIDTIGSGYNSMRDAITGRYDSAVNTVSVARQRLGQSVADRLYSAVPQIGSSVRSMSDSLGLRVDRGIDETQLQLGMAFPGFHPIVPRQATSQGGIYPPAIPTDQSARSVRRGQSFQPTLMSEPSPEGTGTISVLEHLPVRNPIAHIPGLLPTHYHQTGIPCNSCEEIVVESMVQTQQWIQTIATQLVAITNVVNNLVTQQQTQTQRLLQSQFQTQLQLEQQTQQQTQEQQQREQQKQSQLAQQEVSNQQIVTVQPSEGQPTNVIVNIPEPKVEYTDYISFRFRDPSLPYNVAMEQWLGSDIVAVYDVDKPDDSGKALADYLTNLFGSW